MGVRLGRPAADVLVARTGEYDVVFPPESAMELDGPHSRIPVRSSSAVAA